MFDDLPYDYYAVLPPWYQPMSRRRGHRLLHEPGRQPVPAGRHLQRPLDLQPAQLRAPPPARPAPPDRRLQGREPEPQPDARLAGRRASEPGLQLPPRQRPDGDLDRAGRRRVRLGALEPPARADRGDLGRRPGRRRRAGLPAPVAAHPAGPGDRLRPDARLPRSPLPPPRPARADAPAAAPVARPRDGPAGGRRGRGRRRPARRARDRPGAVS